MTTRLQEAKKAVRRFWVAGTAGAFLSGLSRTIPVDLATISRTPNWPYTAELVLRYIYMLWFLSYFAIASFSTEREAADHSTKWNIAYDVTHSMLAIVAVYYLGFVTRGKPENIAETFQYANFAILFLSAMSWLMFKSWERPCSRISVLRLLAGILSGLGLASAVFLANSLRARNLGIQIWMFVLQLGLIWVLGYYGKMHWTRDDIEAFEREPFAITARLCISRRKESPGRVRPPEPPAVETETSAVGSSVQAAEAKH